MLLEGIFLPLTTPFYPDERLYLRKLEANTEHYSRTPAAGMFVFGDASESDGLSGEETHAVLESVGTAAGPSKVLLACVRRESVSAAVTLAEQAAHAHFDCIVLRAPELAVDPTLEREVLLFFEAVADRSPLPVVLLSDSLRPLADATVAHLAGIPAIVGVLDMHRRAPALSALREQTTGVTREVTVTPSFAAVTGRMLAGGDRSGNVEASSGSFVSAASLGTDGGAVATQIPRPALKTRTKRVGFQILTGASASMVRAFEAGACGAAPRLGACAPQACCEVYQAFRDSDLPLANEKAARLAGAAEQVSGWRGIAALKYGCDFNGYFGGRPRLPLVGLTAEERASVEQALAGIRN